MGYKDYLRMIMIELTVIMIVIMGSSLLVCYAITSEAQTTRDQLLTNHLYTLERLDLIKNEINSNLANAIYTKIEGIEDKEEPDFDTQSLDDILSGMEGNSL